MLFRLWNDILSGMIFCRWDDILSRRVRKGGGVHVHPPPPPTWEKSSARKCPKEERKFRPDMSAKNNVHVPLRYDKIKTKNVGKKEDISKRKR